jgi:hypothetical protein
LNVTTIFPEMNRDPISTAQFSHQCHRHRIGFDRSPGLPNIGNVINIDPETGHNPGSKNPFYARVVDERDAALTAQA